MANEIRVRAWPGVVFGIVVLILALGNFSVGIYPFGMAVVLRPTVAAVGIAGAICLMIGNGWWRILLPMWCLIQVPVIATDVSGEWFYQGLFAGFRNTTSVKMNNVLTEYTASGVNFAGFVLLAMVSAIALLRWHPTARRRMIPAGTRKYFLIALVLILGGTACGEIIHLRNEAALYVLDLDLPGVPIYYKDQMLGRTPLRVTPELVRAWKLPVDAGKELKLFGWGWGDCAILSDGSAYLPLYAGVPWPYGDYLDTFESPWGMRCRFSLGGESGNRRTGTVERNAALREEPVLTMEVLDAQPVTAGAPLHVRCVLSNSTAKNYVGREAHIERHWFSYDRRDPSPPITKARRDVTMQASWNSLPAGATMKADVEFEAPTAAGDQEFFCTWFLYAPEKDSTTGAGSVYSNMVRLRVR